MESARQAGWYYIGSRGKRALESGTPASAFEKARLLPSEFLHPSLPERVYPAFLRGDYDNAVLAAFREVEIEVRSASSLPNEMLRFLMREAFPSRQGILTDQKQVKSEREALSFLFAGLSARTERKQDHPRGRLDASEAVR